MNSEDLKKHILSRDDLKMEKMFIQEWDCDVWVKQLSGKQLDIWEMARDDINKKDGIVGLRAKIASYCLADEEGKLIFTEKDIKDLSEKSGAALGRIMAKCMTLNFISQDDLETIAKN